MEGSKQRLMVIYDLQIDIRNVLRCWNSDCLAHIFLLLHQVMVLQKLLWAASIIFQLEYNPLTSFTSSSRKLFHSIRYVFRCDRVLPVIRRKYDLFLGSYNEIAHVTHDIRNTRKCQPLLVYRGIHTDTEMTVKGIVPQLPISDGLTIQPETLLSIVHSASWYNYNISWCSFNSYTDKLTRKNSSLGLVGPQLPHSNALCRSSGVWVSR